MKQLRGLLLMSLASAFSLGGCVLHDWHDDACEDDEWSIDVDDYDDYTTPGDEACETNEDCGGGWVCDVY